MLSTKGKRFGIRTALGALALGIGLAGASVATAPKAEAYGWHHGGGWHGGWYGPRVTLGFGGYYPGYYYGYRPRYYHPPAYYYPPAYVPYGGVGVVIR